MQHCIDNPKCSSTLPLSSASFSGSPQSSALACADSTTTTMQKAQPVSSTASPSSITTPTGRSYADPNKPIFALQYNAGKYVKMSAVNVCPPKLHGVSPTSVASPLAPSSMRGIQSGPVHSGGILGNNIGYGFRSPSRELVFEPVNRSIPLRGTQGNNIMICTPCNDVIVNEEDTSKDTSGIVVASTPIASSSRMPVSLLTLRNSSSFESSLKRASVASRSAVSVSNVATSSPTSCGATSPTPQNLKDNPERLAKVKTEMCRYFETGGLKNCPWGDKCNYAHGKHELKFNYSTLKLMESSGQITDAQTYLTRPCMTWISTGACPFGRRCPAIHDPSITGPVENPSWLPAASSKTNAQIIVDRLAAHRDNAVHQVNPLIAQGIWENCRPSHRRLVEASSTLLSLSDADGGDTEVEWLDTYALICNMGTPAFGSWSNARSYLGRDTAHPPASKSSAITSSTMLSELQKLCIVRCMRGQRSMFVGNSNEDVDDSQELHLLHRDYVYAPTHSLHSELCMVLQTRYFLLLNTDTSNESSARRTVVKEISLDEYKARTTPWNMDYQYKKSNVVVAHEVAFAPKGDSSANVSIWFEATPVKLESSQIKRCRRLKQKKKAQLRSGHKAPHSNGALLCRTSTADFPTQSAPDIDPFVPMLPAEDGAENDEFMLAILDHRIDCLISDSLSRDCAGNSYALRKVHLAKRMLTLQAQFVAMSHFHQKWTWPKREGSEVVTESTFAPPCNIMPYIPSRSSDGSFVDTVALKGDSAAANAYDKSKVNMNVVKEHHLSTFQALGNGASLPTSSVGHSRIPRIKLTADDSDDADKENDSTWKEIVLGADGMWKNACRVYNESKVTTPSNIDQRNMPLSTIPFVPPQLPKSQTQTPTFNG